MLKICLLLKDAACYKSSIFFVMDTFTKTTLKTEPLIRTDGPHQFIMGKQRSSPKAKINPLEIICE